MLQEYYYCSFLNIQVAFCWDVHHQTKQSYKGADVAIWSPFDIFFKVDICKEWDRYNCFYWNTPKTQWQHRKTVGKKQTTEGIVSQLPTGHVKANGHLSRINPQHASPVQTLLPQFLHQQRRILKSPVLSIAKCKQLRQLLNQSPGPSCRGSVVS